MRSWDRPLWKGSIGLALQVLLFFKLNSLQALDNNLKGRQFFDYDENLAKISLVYSSAAYMENPYVENWTLVNQDCINRTESFFVNETYKADGTDAFGYVGIDVASQLVVGAFKGTSTFRDWITDLHTFPHYNTACIPGLEDDSGLEGHVHHGFCSYYKDLVELGLADRIILLATENPDYSILLTGHSLGASAAAICAADLTQRLGLEGERVVVYTLGEPRTGDGDFAEGLDGAVGTAYRLVHNHDIVPHLAPCCHDWHIRCKAGVTGCPYHHADEVVYDEYMGEGANFTVCNGTVGENYKCDPQAVDLSVSDHQIYFQLDVAEHCALEEDLPYRELKRKVDKRWAGLEDTLKETYAFQVQRPWEGGLGRWGLGAEEDPWIEGEVLAEA